MNYEKPEATVLGDAALLVQGFKPKHGESGAEIGQQDAELTD